MKQIALVLIIGMVSMSIDACTARPFPTITIYEDPSRFVRLEADPRVGTDDGHTHPVNINTHTMAAVLSGLMIVHPPKWRSWFGDSEAPRHPAFTKAEIEFYAPLIAVALRRATAEEVVTFYESRHETAIVRKVTSGQIYVRGEQMHLVLANYRASTHYASDPGVADTQDDRLTPSRPIAPQVERLEFEPATAIVEEGLFGHTPRQVIVRFKDLPVAAATPIVPQP